MEPVEDVKVTWWNGYFTVKTARTNANGCWRIRGHSERGKAYMWVTFRNDKAKLRGFVGNTVDISRLLRTIEDNRGQLGGGSYNNVQVTYPIWNNQGGSAHRYWSASTVINAIHHFHREAQADGVNTPPMGLDVFLASKSTTGAALMTSQIPHSLQNDWVVDGLWGVSLLPYVISDISVLSIVPDVVIDCNLQNSDRLYAITQHELAHASHFTNVGSEYWGLLILAEINAELFTGSPWGGRECI